MKSFLTVHSVKNLHWEERIEERGNVQIEDPEVKKEILNELKQIL